MCLTTLDIARTAAPEKPPVSGTARIREPVTDKILRTLSESVATETGVRPKGDPSPFDLVDAEETGLPTR